MNGQELSKNKNDFLLLEALLSAQLDEERPSRGRRELLFFDHCFQGDHTLAVACCFVYDVGQNALNSILQKMAQFCGCMLTAEGYRTIPSTFLV